MQQAVKKTQDATTTRIFAALKQAFPKLPDDPDQVVYRYNPVAIRVRIVSPKFRGKTDAEREEIVKRAFKSLPDAVTEDITMLFMLTPDEARKPTLLDREFDDPTGEYL